MTIGERIKLSREKAGLSQVDLAAKIDIKKQTLYKYENNLITNIPSDKIELIANICEVTPSYIMGWDEKSENEDDQILYFKENTIIMCPLYNSVAAGFGVLPQNNPVSYIPTNINVASEKDLYIWITVTGDSMAPLIENGSEILIRKQSSVDSGQIAVVLIDGEDAVVKKVIYGSDWIELQSINPYYPIRRFEGTDISRITILGLVKKVSNALN